MYNYCLINLDEIDMLLLHIFCIIEVLNHRLLLVEGFINRRGKYKGAIRLRKYRFRCLIFFLGIGDGLSFRSK